jgi:hypothetical protein
MTKEQFIGELKRFAKDKRKELGMTDDSSLDFSSLVNQSHLTLISRASWISGDSMLEAAKKQIENALLFVQDQKKTILSDWLVYVFHLSGNFQFQPHLINGVVFAKKDGSVSYGIDGILYRNVPGRRPLAKDLNPGLSLMTPEGLGKMAAHAKTLHYSNLNVIFLAYFFETHQGALSALLQGAEGQSP